MTNIPDTLTVPQAAARLGISKWTLYNHLESRDPDMVKKMAEMGADQLGNRRFFRRPIFERYLNGTPKPEPSPFIRHIGSHREAS